MKWINIKTRLPKEGEWVLAYTRKQINFLFFDGKINEKIYWLCIEGDWNHEVTH